MICYINGITTKTKEIHTYSATVTQKYRWKPCESQEFALY